MSNSKKGSLYSFLIFSNLIFWHLSSVTAQNLVFNPSFSERNEERFLFWQSYFADPTPYFYNSNKRLDTAVCFTAESYGKVPKTTTSYGWGMHVFYGRLKQQLKAGVYYQVTFNIRPSDSTKLFLTRLGVGFKKSYDPPILFDLSEVNRTADWSTLKGVYLAKGGERYLYIGKFSEEHSEYFWNDKFPKKDYASRWEWLQDGYKHRARYIIDNVSLEELPHQPAFSYSEKFTSENVFFETAKHNLSEASKAYLLMLASFLRSKSDLLITVEGFADKRGNDEYNLQLSKKRAISVAEFLLKQGIAKSRIKPLWHGSKGADNSPANYHLDRKVQFELVRTP